MDTFSSKGLLSTPVIIAALGYFVDIYDLTVFGIVRVPSLESMGLDTNQVSTVGTQIYNAQLFGLIIGGFIWGIIGDKLGRRSILFGSIFTYSIANILNGFVHSTDWYIILRFIAGLGLAGELGAGITLIAEIIKKESRSYATSLITGLGLMGAVVAYLTYEFTNWRTTFIVGGVLGILLLIGRVKFLESSLFLSTVKEIDSSKRGNLRELFFIKKNIITYLSCIGIAIPIYFFYGIFAAFSNEIGTFLGISEPIDVGKCVMLCYLGLSIGDMFSGPLSDKFKSRKKVMLTMMIGLFITALFLLSPMIKSAYSFYVLVFIGGLFSGYWALFMIATTESFGTHLRATATTSAPNMVRGALILILMLFQYFKGFTSIGNAILIVGGICFGLALISHIALKESYNKELDYTK